MSKVEETVTRYLQGLSCSQSVFVVYRQPMGLSESDALKLSTVFGAGMCGTGCGLCGAASGALLALSMRHGMDGIDSLDAKARTYELGRQFLAEFGQRMDGVTTCEGILGMSPLSTEYKERSKELRATKCAGAVRTAAEILESML